MNTYNEPQPQPRKVTRILSVIFNGREYDVSTVPFARAGETILVGPHESKPGAVFAIKHDKYYHETIRQIYPLNRRGFTGGW